jgi:SHS2 domain-containing protein
LPEFEILEHTADIGLRVQADSLTALFAAAVLALQSISLDAALVEPQNRYELSASGEDLEALLVNWLNEIIFFLDGRRVALGRIEVAALELEPSKDFEIHAAAWGEPLDAVRHPMHLVVKAATYHQLKIVRHEETGWTAEIFLDI